MRRQQLRAESDVIVTRVTDYTSLHDAEIAAEENAVKQQTITHLNDDIDEFFVHVADYARNVRTDNPIAPPTSDGPAIPPPAFTRLKALTTEGSAYSVVGRLQPGISSLQQQQGGTKRKTSTVAANPIISRQRTTAPGTQTSSYPPSLTSFQQQMLEQQLPHDGCFHTWRGLSCNRSNRSLDHIRVHLGETAQIASTPPPLPAPNPAPGPGGVDHSGSPFPGTRGRPIPCPR